MRLFAFSISLFLTVTSLAATPTQELFEGQTEGFLQPSSSALPETVRRAAENVYLAVLVEQQFIQIKELNNSYVGQPQKSPFKSGADGLAELISFAELDGYVGTLERSYFGKDDDRFARLYVAQGLCSSFTTGDGSKVHMARHCLNDWQGYRDVPKIHQQEWLHSKAIIFFDRHGKKIAGPLTSEQLGVTIENLGEPLSELAIGNDSAPDNVELQAVHVVAPPLEIGDASAPSEALYIIGYPSPTGSEAVEHNADTRARRQGLNAGHNMQMITQGRELSLAEMEFVFPQFGLESSYQFKSLSYWFGTAAEPHNKALRFLSADNMNAMSGGPIVNSLGKVVGVDSTYFTLKTKKDPGSSDYRTLTIFERPLSVSPGAGV